MDLDDWRVFEILSGREDQMEKPLKIAVFTGDLCYLVRKCIVGIVKAIAGVSWLIVVHSPRKLLPQLLNKWRGLITEARFSLFGELWQVFEGKKIQ